MNDRSWLKNNWWLLVCIGFGYFLQDKMSTYTLSWSWILAWGGIFSFLFIHASIGKWKYNSKQIIFPSLHYSHITPLIEVDGFAIITLGDFTSDIYDDIATEGMAIVPITTINKNYRGEMSCNVELFPRQFEECSYNIQQKLILHGFQNKRILWGIASNVRLQEIDANLKLEDDTGKEIEVDNVIAMIGNLNRTITEQQRALKNKFEHINRFVEFASNTTNSLNKESITQKIKNKLSSHRRDDY